MKFSGKMWIKIKSHKNKQTNKQTNKTKDSLSLKKLQQLSKFEVKEHFPRFLSFNFVYRAKLKTQKFSLFLLNAYLGL